MTRPPLPVRSGIAICLLVLLGCSGGQQPTPPAEPAARPDGWQLAQALLGDWIDSTSSDSFVVHEAWRPMDDSTLIGRGHVLAGKDTVFIEALRLGRRKGQLVYAALPGGEDAGTFTEFIAVPTGRDTLLFSNHANDFPQHIRYLRDGQGWHAAIFGSERGRLREEHFRFLPR
ncbi:MAG: hypothetical protein JNL05_02785 [Flavobacteriales bacterium]|nr:hypothetical protein [Flavobacteriales bacterium]